MLVASGYVTPEDLTRLKHRNLTMTKLKGHTIGITDSFWYLHSLKEIFCDELYRFESNSPTPRIIDCGANIGLSVLYLKTLYPNADITAFEPDPHIFSLLSSNLQAFGVTDVVLENKALWTEDTVLQFSSAGSLGGKLIDNASPPKIDTIPVRTAKLTRWLQNRTDFLKLDIEGAEVDVLQSCADVLSNVDNLFVEYHSLPSKPQQLDILISLLRKAGFRIYIKEAWNNLPIPFQRENYTPYYDMQLNIFAYRTKEKARVSSSSSM
jgi:FkbM family methyltransferase